MRKRVIFFLAAALALGAFKIASADDQNKFVASVNSDRYHVLDCKVVQKIFPEDKVFFKSTEEAEAAGYVPCKKCNPSKVKSNIHSKSRSQPSVGNLSLS